MADKHKFEIGDWVVHSFHGVGQIMAISNKGINGNKKTYYKVATKDLKYWVPMEMDNNNRIVQIRSQKAFDKALKVLANAPKPLPDHYKSRKNKINKRWSIGNLLSRIRLLRDLYGRKVLNKLNFNERGMMEKTRKFLVDEMILSDNTLTRQQADKMIDDALSRSQQKIQKSA
jgi:RNA polymerase-interacting CarD/CdnL/TRCF family regulator